MPLLERLREIIEEFDAEIKVAIEAAATEIVLDPVVINGECFMQVTVFEEPRFRVLVPFDDALQGAFDLAERSDLAMKLRQIADELDAHREFKR